MGISIIKRRPKWDRLVDLYNRNICTGKTAVLYGDGPLGLIVLHVPKCFTHWGRVTHICVGILTIIGSDYGLSPGQRQAIIWTNAGILLIGPWGTNFSEILIGIQTFSLKKIRLKMSSAKCRPFCLGLNMLTTTLAMQSLISDVSR